MTEEFPQETPNASGNAASSDSPKKTPTRRAGSKATRERKKTMADVNHVHPHADRGAMTRLFGRGPVATDGGEYESSDENTKTMADIRHSPPTGAGDSAGVFERGHEYRVQYR